MGQSLAERHILRLQNAVAQGDELFNQGREAYAAGDFEKAVEKFNQALGQVPNAPLFQDRRASYTEHLSNSRIALAMVYREKGRLAEANTLLTDVLTLQPDNADAKRELAKLNDPVQTNPALTLEYTKDVDEVMRLLNLADGEFNLGKYDSARSAYEKILRIDPYNTTARRGLERVAAIKSDYYRVAYDHTRAELLQQVDQAWEISLPEDVTTALQPAPKDNQVQFGVAYITEKLRSIIIPSINFDNTTVEEAMEFLRQRSAELDRLETDPNRKGINFVLRLSGDAPAAPAAGDAGGGVGGDPTLDNLLGAVTGGAAGSSASTGRIKLMVRNVPLEVALKYVCEQAKLRYKVDNYSVTLVPQTNTEQEFFTRNFSVPPDFREKLSEGAGAGAAAEADPFAAPGAATATNTIQPLKPVLDLLKNAGVLFPEGASATLSGSSLLVTNTPAELDKIEALINVQQTQLPKQVKITTKFVEITQENGEELGFDWVISPFAFGGNDGAGAGGTLGNGADRTGFDFSGPQIPGVTNSSSAVRNIVTGGNRSGDFAISGNSIDSILNNPTRAVQSQSVAPGIMSFTGLFTDGQLKVIMRGLSQKKGVDLMTAPSITARSGERATIEIIREFIYPTEYDPPEPPQQNNNNQFGGQGGGGFPIAVPANPTAFETRNTGVSLEIEPTIGENDFMINLRFAPEIVEFEGFINYGSPIQTGGVDEDGNPVQIVVTENRIEMPVFSTRRVNTALTIYDGYTVALGGLMREDVQNVEDKVPVLGDIPLIGRLFQTKAEKRTKKNLIIFVKAQIIDPTGRPLRGADAVTVPVDNAGTAPGTLDLPPLD